MPNATVPLRAQILLATLTLVWGTNWPLFALAVREVSVWTFRAVAVTVAGLVLLAIARLRGQSLLIPRQHRVRICVATFFYLVLWNIASTYSAILIPSGQSAVLGFTMPLWSALISWAVLGERLGKRLVLAVALGAAAVTLLMVPSFATYAQAPLGLALGLLAGLGWAIGTLILKRGKVDVPATVLTGWQLLISALPTAIGALVLGDGHWFVPIVAVDRRDRLHRARSDGAWQRLLVRDRRHAAGQRRRLVGGDGAGRGHSLGRVGPRRAAGAIAVARHGMLRRGLVACVGKACRCRTGACLNNVSTALNAGMKTGAAAASCSRRARDASRVRRASCRRTARPRSSP